MNGFGNADFILARFKKNGDPDFSFGTGGRVATDFNGANDLAQGSIVAASRDGVAQLVRSPHTSYAAMRRPKPFSSSSPTGVASTLSSTAANARWPIRI